MYLDKIVLYNFRQFYGEQEIKISSDPEKNVTLIHAENGVGKTTLLNALLWCFYKDTTAKFETSDKIVANQAIAEDIYKTKVEVFFTHENASYVVSRSINEKYDDEEFIVYSIINGSYTTLTNPHTFIKTVIPQEMSKYFFFDGEYAETFSSSNNKDVVKVALESMLGCNTATQALYDLSIIRKKIDKDIAILTKNNQAAVFQDNMDRLEEENKKDDANVKALITELDLNKNTQHEIIKALRNSEGATEIQERREGLEVLKTKSEKRKIDIEKTQTKWINKSSVGLIASSVISKQAAVEKEANIKGLIPSRIAETFVGDILDEGSCICGRSFSAGSSEESKIKGLLQEAGSITMNDRLMSIRELVGTLNQSSNNAWEEFHEITSQLNVANEEINDYELKIKECSKQLGASDVSEIKEREQSLEKCNQIIGDLSGKIKLISEGQKNYSKDIEGLRQKRDQLLLKNERAQGLNKKILLIDAIFLRLDGELAKYRKESREVITGKLNNILKKTARREYTARIDEIFNLSMFFKDIPVAKSSGENQLLSLAFIAALVEFSSDRCANISHLLKPGTMAPLMLDSPFGQLDPSYRKSTADFLPVMANQVILLVSQSQGDEGVIESLKDHIGEEYVLVSENTDEQGNKPKDVITVQGKKIECSVYGAEKNMTRIHRII